jgi:hypothetical protein
LQEQRRLELESKLVEQAGIRAEQESDTQMALAQLTREDCSWLACAIDSEGTVYQHTKGHPHIVIYNKNRDYVEHFVALTTTNLREHHGNGLKPSLLFTARVSRSDILLELIPLILPYLIIKKERALRCLEWLIANQERKRPKSDVQNHSEGLLGAVQVRTTEDNMATKTKLISAQVPAEEARVLELQATSNDLTVSQVIRKLVKLYLAEPTIINDETLARAK